MNFKIIFAFLGVVGLLLGACMIACIPWGTPPLNDGVLEAKGVGALFKSSLISFVVGLVFHILGRGADSSRLYLREAFACVSLCWILAILLGTLPYLLCGVERLKGVPFTFADALFESSSGLTTTGASVFGELEDPSTLPRSILFWRCLTHFIGGLGVVCCFVAFLGKGASGKAILKVEHLFSGALPFVKIQSLAWSLVLIYFVLFLSVFIWFLFCGASLYDSITHAFSITSNGGFSTRNDSAGFFSQAAGVRTNMLEYGMVFFMAVSGINFWLLYWASRGSFEKLFKDVDFRFYITSILVVSILATVLGVVNHNFVFRGTRAPTANIQAHRALAQQGKHPCELEGFESGTSNVVNGQSEPSVRKKCVIVCKDYNEAFRNSLFQTVSLMTSTGLAVCKYEYWNVATMILFIFVMVMGGCAGSPAGGVKVYRMALALRLIVNETQKKFRPNVVKITQLGGQNVEPETAGAALRFIAAYCALVFITALVVAAIEPDSLWTSQDRSPVEKLFDVFMGTIAMFSNTGLAFGSFGSTGNFGSISEASKIIFSWAMIVGRLEIWCVLALFSPAFWRNR